MTRSPASSRPCAPTTRPSRPKRTAKDQLEAAQTTIAELADGLSHAGHRLLDASQHASKRLQARLEAAVTAERDALADE